MSIRSRCAVAVALAAALALAGTPALAGPVAGFLGTILGVGAGGSVLGVFGALLGRVVLTVGLAYLARALAPKPPTPKPGDRLVNYAQPVSVMERGYGRVRKGGPICFTGFRNKTRHYGVLIAAQSTKGPVAHWLDKLRVEVDQAGNVTTEPVAGAGTLRCHTGQPGQQADPVWRETFPEITASHDFAGLSYAALGARRVGNKAFTKTYPRGREWEYLPLWDMHDQIFDPRDGQSKWTDNAALIIAHEALFFGKQVDWAEVAAEADVCDALVTNAGGGQQRRWTINGVFDDEMDWETVRDALAVAADAFFFERPDGKLGFRVGRWIAPTLTLTARDILSISVSEMSWGPDVIGAVTIRYVEPARDWTEAVSGAWVEDPAAPRAEREAFLVNSHNQAARIAKRIARVSRARYSIRMRVKLVGYETLGARFIRVTHAEMGLDIVVEIGRISRAADGLTFDIEAVSVTPDDFAFNAAVEEPARPAFLRVISEDDVAPPASLTGAVVADTGGAAAIEWAWPRQDASLQQELRIRLITSGQLAPPAAAAFPPSAGITDDAFGGQQTRVSDASFRAVAPLPATPTDGVLFERGGDGQGLWIGLRGGGATLRYRVGDGRAAAASGFDVIVIDVATADLPFDGQDHEIEWDVRIEAPARARLWLDGVLIASGETTDGSRIWGWAGSGPGSYGHLAQAQLPGEPTTGWPVTVTQELLIWPGLREDQAASDWQHTNVGAGQTSFLATGLIDGATYQAQLRNRTGANRASDWAPAQPVSVQALANTAPPAALQAFDGQPAGGDAALSFAAPNDGGYFATRLYRAVSGAGESAATLRRTEFGAPGAADAWSDIAPGSGAWDYWAEPINASGIAGPRAGPVTVTIV